MVSERRVTVEQPDLLGAVHTIGANGRPLKPAQQVAYNLVRDTPGGVTADEVGAALHERLTTRWQHPADQRCLYCGDRGKQVLGSKAVGPLVIRRKGGKYELRNPESTTRAPADLPGDSWEDLFGDAA